MATYIILNVFFIAVVLVLLRIYTIPHLRAWSFTLITLIVLTILFDNILIYFEVVGYNLDKILGVYIGIAPIEDFFYPLLAALLIPAVWHKLGERNAKQT